MTIMMQDDLAHIVSAIGLPPDLELGRPVALSQLEIPDKVRLENDKVAWCLEPKRRRRVDPQLLRRFIDLREAPDREVVEFVRTWGPLRIGETPIIDGSLLWSAMVDPTTDKLVDIARLSRRWAWCAFGTLNCARLLREGKMPNNADWARAIYGAVFEINPDFVKEPMRCLALALSGWFATPLHLVWVPPSRRGPIKPPGFAAFNPLFAALALQLASAVCGTGGIGICAECGQPFTRRRKVAPRTAEYCSRCGKRASWRRASAKARRKRARARRMKSERADVGRPPIANTKNSLSK